MKIDITNFGGMAPLVAPFALAGNLAQVAIDALAEEDLAGYDVNAGWPG